MTPFLKQLIERGCITAAPDTPLKSITEVMTEQRIGTVVICQDDKIAGIVSERDVIRTIANHGAITGMAAADIMTKDVKVITPDINSTQIMEMMSRHQIRHVPIAEDGALLGIVSITDVVRRLSEKTEEEAALMREFINS